MNVMQTGLRVMAPAGKVVVALAAVVALWVTLPSPAEAHSSLIASNPTDGARLDSLPSEVSLTFDQNVASPAFVAVAAPDGSSLVKGPPQVLDGTVTQPIEAVAERGEYTLSFRVVSADGHPISDTLSFAVTQGEAVAGSPAADPTQEQASPERESFWTAHTTHFVVGGVAIVAALCLLIGGAAPSRKAIVQKRST